MLRVAIVSIGVLGVTMGTGVPAAAARRHPGGGLPLDQLPPQVRAMREEPPGSTAAEWQRWNIAFHDSLVAVGDTTSTLYAYAVEGLVEGRLSVQDVSTQRVRELAWRALELKRAHLGPEHVEIVRTLINVALVESYGFETDRIADSLLVHAVGIQRRVPGADPRSVVPILSMRARMLNGIDDVAALATLDTVIAIESAAARPDSFRILGCLALRGEIRAQHGYVEEAVDAQRRLLAFYLRKRPDDERGIAIDRSNLGTALMVAGHPGEALVEFSRARDGLLRHLGAEHFEFRTWEAQVGNVYYQLGDLESARRHFEVALKRNPGESLERGDLLEPTVGLGRLELDAAHPDRARELMEEGVRGFAARPDRPQFYTIQTLEILADCLLTLHRPDSALIVIASAKQIVCREDPECDDCTPPALRIVEAAACLALRDTTRAIAVLDSMVVEVEAHPARRAPFAWRARLALARLALGRGELDRAFDLALSVERQGRREILAAVDGLPDRWALRLAALRPSGLGILVELSAFAPQSAGVRGRTVLDQAIRSRALILDFMAGRRSLAQQRAQSEIAPLWLRWDTARRRLRELDEESNARRTDGARERRRAALVRELDLVEADLAERRSAERTGGSGADTIGVDAVARALRGGDVLVSYLRLRREGDLLETRHGRSARTAGSYVAFVLAHGMNWPMVVRLGEAKPIDHAVDAWLALSGPSVRAPQDEASLEAGHRLRALVWDPILPGLTGAKRVFVVPDGRLGLIDPSVLPDGHGRFLAENEPRVVMIGCERDLHALPESGSQSPGRMLAVGGVDYQQAGIPPGETLLASFAAGTEAGAASAVGIYRGPRSTCDRLENLQFEFLPASIPEISELEQSAARAIAPVGVVILRGSDASESTLKLGAPGSRALHLATHGFVTPPSCAGGFSAAARTRGFATSDDPVVLDNPLTRCGLALAGANRRAEAGPDEDDGLLTGDEIAALDLSGVEFVVLSACNSGLGDVLDGEGVLGLQRAFKIAGVGPLVMSLWPVEDQIARHWMRHFYAARLAPGVTTAEATRRASLAMLAERRRLGLSTRPSTWAAFVSVGVER